MAMSGRFSLLPAPLPFYEPSIRPPLTRHRFLDFRLLFHSVRPDFDMNFGVDFNGNSKIRASAYLSFGFLVFPFFLYYLLRVRILECKTGIPYLGVSVNLVFKLHFST